MDYSYFMFYVLYVEQTDAEPREGQMFAFVCEYNYYENKVTSSILTIKSIELHKVSYNNVKEG